VSSPLFFEVYGWIEREREREREGKVVLIVGYRGGCLTVEGTDSLGKGVEGVTLFLAKG
jgi:hypothetical protein